MNAFSKGLDNINSELAKSRLHHLLIIVEFDLANLPLQLNDLLTYLRQISRRKKLLYCRA